MVELKNVDVHYVDGAKGGVDALNDINIRVNDGEFVFIVGDSGAGKSTLLKLLTREIQPTGGRVFVNGYNLTKLRRRKLPYFRRSLGMIFQDFRLIPTLTVYENVAFVLRVIDKSKKYIRQRVPYVLDLVKLNDKAKAYPGQLSGGEQQRVAIARAFACDPKIIIADEPTGNIDPKLSYEIVELLQDINECGTTVIMVTHNHDLVKYFGGRIINLKEGSIAFDGYIEGE
ncbi:MAG: cell division ATP-binding protein FtsE [Ruminiclostridium sp.]|nr:cell division ATP-binding protein FtsE [Ruminiclostridium sp.]HBI51893.1 cell division ATP-binding protein FtsE [Oscillospiraceae bacterium]